MKKRISLFLIVVLVLMTTFTGCQTTKSEVQQPATATEVETTPEVTAEVVEKVEGIILPDELKDLSVRDAKGFNGVVASANAYATKIGLDVMKNGGNAVDAAIAVSFTLGLVEPNASGPGGYGTMLIHNATTNEQAYLDYMGTAPAALTQEIYESYQSKSTDPDRTSGKAALVPGSIDGWLKALDTYGTMSIDDILAPVIELAREGYEISPHSVAVLQDSYMTLLKYEESSKVFLNEGLPYENGDIVKNEDYAQLLEKIAVGGRDAFYKGEVAESIVKAVQDTGGIMTMEDLANYESKWREPIRIDYKGYEVITAAPPSAGGVALLEALNIVENADISGYKQNSVEMIQLLEEALKYAHADRYNLVGDPDFVDTDTEGLLSDEYAKYLFDNKIQKDKPSEDQKASPYTEYESADTTHLTIMDKDGNMVSMTNTVSLYYGCAVVPKDLGFVLNSATFNFSKAAYPVNQVLGGNRARSTISPTVILKDNKTYMAIGTPGGGRISGTLLQVIVNILDFDMGIQEAILQPRIDTLNKGPLYIEGGMAEDVITQLETMGHDVSMKGSLDSHFGGVHGIIRDQSTGEMHGGADPRRDGKALAF